MTNIADELLEELETLEQTTDMLESQVQDVKDTRSKLKNAPTPQEINTAALLLEAIKATQKATENSQESAQINLRIADKQQMHLDDLQDIALSSRQAMRNASQDNKSIRSFVAGVSITAIVLLGGIAGVSAWFFYEGQKQQIAFEQSIIDIIKTENTLNQRQLNLKINELASIIEVSVENPISTDVNFDESLNDTLLEQVETLAANEQLTKEITQLKQWLESATETNQQQLSAFLTKTNSDIAALKRSTDTLAKNLATQPASTTAIPNLMPRFNALDTQLKQIQQLVQSRTDLSTGSNHKTTPLDDKEIKQLEIKVLELTKQQQALEKAVDTLTTTIGEMQKELANPSQHYRYRNPYEYSN